jgi:C-terminal processing protease CtpA/Prc
MIAAYFALLPLQTPTEDFAAVWADCRKAVEARYYARTAKREQMIRFLDEFEPLAKAATTRKEFGDIMKRMVARFGDSHFDFLTNHEQGFYLMDGFRGESAEKFPNVGAWFKNSGDGYTVTMVLEGSTAWDAKLRKGGRRRISSRVKRRQSDAKGGGVKRIRNVPKRNKTQRENHRAQREEDRLHARLAYGEQGLSR